MPESPESLRASAARLNAEANRYEDHARKLRSDAGLLLTAATAAELKANEAIPVDRSRQTLTDGSPVPDDRSHVELKDNGQQRGYVVLSEEERARGFVRPVRRSYVHDRCGTVTTMSQSIAETYSRCPTFYSGTYCCGCGRHFPVGEDGEFTWDDGSGEKVGT
ncbi:MAG: hypothetical protein KGO96_10645 [Elusimicrobia bacterium]|nr:hypothetical protein [Elusimicrobiota bacterium]